MNLIIGSQGRFARAIKGVLANESTHSTSFLDLLDGSFENKNVILNSRFENCFWVAGPGSSNSSFENFEFQGLKSLLNLTRKYEIEIGQFIYFSTAGKIYGKNPGYVSESSQIIPVGEYGMQKKKCEDLLMNCENSSFRRLSILRIANAFSPANFEFNPQGVIETFVHSARNHRAVRVKANLQSKRQYSTHKSYVEFILKHALPQLATSESRRIVNIAPTEVATLEQIIQIIEEKLKMKCRVYLDGNDEDSVIISSEFITNEKFAWETLRETLLP